MRYIIYASLKEQPDHLYRIDEYGDMRMALNKAKELREKRDDVNYIVVDSLLNETIN